MTNGTNKPNKKKQATPKFNPYMIYIPILIGILWFGLTDSGSNAKKTSWSEVEDLVANDFVSKIVINKKEVVAYIYILDHRIETYKSDYGDGRSIKSNQPAFSLTIAGVDYAANRIDKINEGRGNSTVPVIYESGNNFITWFFEYAFFPLLFLFLFYYLFLRPMRSKGGGGGLANPFNVGRSRAKLFDPQSKTKTKFKNVAGMEGAKQEVVEVVDFLKKPTKYTKLGGKIPKGVLLVGPPGTGKTLLAKAVAGEANVPFFSMSGSDFVEMFVGIGASRVRDLFKQAKEKAPCIIFIDEIDAIGRSRGKSSSFSANDERENTLNQLLTEMDGFEANNGVIVLAATNRANILDKALLRAGRFDRQVYVELPDVGERKAIFRVHTRNIKYAKSLDFNKLSRQTPGFSGADIANICNEAALISARKNRNSVTYQDFTDAIDRVIAGLERKDKMVHKEERRMVAYHEAGHATVSWMLEHAHPLLKVTIIPRGRTLGAAWYMPEERQLSTKKHLMDEMAALLGGRAAEELIFDSPSTGAQNDLERATKMAYSMVCYYGMSEKVGQVSYYDSQQSEMVFSKPYSEQKALLIDEEIKILIDSAYKTAKDILKKHADKHALLAERLLEKEIVVSEDLMEIFGDKKGLWKDLYEDSKPTKKVSKRKTPSRKTKKTSEDNTFEQKPIPPKKKTKREVAPEVKKSPEVGEKEDVSQ